MRKQAISLSTVAAIAFVSAASGGAAVSLPDARAVVASASTSPNVTRVTASFKPYSEASSIASWTQPASTVATVYYRVRLSTPGGSCTSPIAAHVGTFRFWLNGVDGNTQTQSIDMGPGQTQFFPAVGSTSFSGTLLPDSYELETEWANSDVAPDCADTVAKTEVFIETVAKAT
jgi:hypothetical protein